MILIKLFTGDDPDREAQEWTRRQMLHGCAWLDAKFAQYEGFSALLITLTAPGDDYTEIPVRRCRQWFCPNFAALGEPYCAGCRDLPHTCERCIKAISVMDALTGPLCSECAAPPDPDASDPDAHWGTDYDPFASQA